MADKNITELVAAAKAGDSGEMDSLYREYSERLRLFVIKQGLPEQDAEDVVSETFVEVIKHIGQLQNDEYFGTWLHKIALRKIGDLKEKNNRAQRVVLDFSDSEDSGVAKLGGDLAAAELEYETSYGDTVELPSDYAENEEIKQLIADQINSLSQDHREALYLFYYEDKSVADIAQLTGTNVGTIKARLFKARKQLRSKLEVLQKKGVTLCAVPISRLFGVLENKAPAEAAAEQRHSVRHCQLSSYDHYHYV